MNILKHLGLDSDLAQPAESAEPTNLIDLKTAKKKKIKAVDPQATITSDVKFERIPELWLNVKLDLFLNGYAQEKELLKLKLSTYKKADKTGMTFVAALNSDFYDCVSRNVDKEEWQDNPHWITVRKHRKELLKIYNDVRVSRLGLPNNGGATDMVVFVYNNGKNWIVDLCMDSSIYSYVLDGKLTQKQVDATQIATKDLKGPKKKMITAKELGLC